MPFIPARRDRMVRNFLDVRSAVSALWDAVTRIAQIVPPGVILAGLFTKETVPAGYLLCDGSYYGMAEYPVLGNILRNSGDGEYFAVPDLRTRIMVGEDDDPSTTGRLGSGVDNTVASAAGINLRYYYVNWIIKT